MEKLVELNKNHPAVILRWLLVLFISSACIKPLPQFELKDFPNTKLAFSLSSTDPKGIDKVDWSTETTLSIEGREFNSSNSYIYLADLNKTGIITPLTVNHRPIVGYAPRLSPDGKNLAYWGTDGKVYILTVEAPAQTISFSPNFKGDTAWFNDSKTLAIVHLQPNSVLNIDIFYLNGEIKQSLEISDQRFSLYEFDGDITLSTDATRIAFSLQQRVASNKPQADIFVTMLNTGRTTQITNTPDWYDSDVSWSPNGEQLIFLSTPVDDIPQVSGRLTLAKADGACVNTTSYPLGITAVSWGPIEDEIAVVYEEDVYIMSVNSIITEFADVSTTCP